ncbi:MAG: DUF6776 family protein [Pseudomonadota bacterium]
MWWRVLALVPLLILSGSLVWWGMDLGRRLGWMGPAEPAPEVKQQIASLRGALARLSSERDRLAVAGAATGVIDAANKQMETQIKALKVENSKLTEDVGLLESLLPPPQAGAGLHILAFQAEMLTPTELHYVLLLTHGASRKARQFDGGLELAITLQQGAESKVLTFPDRADNVAQYGVTVRRYQRLDGQMTVADGARATAVQVRLLEQGRAIATQSTTVKEAPHVPP